MKELMDQTWWLYDLIVIAIMVLCIWNGWKNGIMRSFFSLLGYAAALASAAVAAQPAAEFVFDKWIEEPCAVLLEEKLEQYDLTNALQTAISDYGIQLDEATLQEIAAKPENAENTLYTAISQKTGVPLEILQQRLSDTIQNTAIQTFSGMPKWMKEALFSDQEADQMQNRAVETMALMLSGDGKSASEALTNQYVRPMCIPILKTFTFSVSFLLISLLIQVIIKGIFVLRRTGTIHGIDQIVGAAAGMVEGIVLVFIMAKITSWLVLHHVDTIGFFHEEAINKTFLFQAIYHIVT